MPPRLARGRADGSGLRRRRMACDRTSAGPCCTAALYWQGGTSSLSAWTDVPKRSEVLAHGTTFIQPGIRRLQWFDRPRLVEYFQRLDQDTRRLRFGRAVGDGFVEKYARTIVSVDSVCFGAFPDNSLRGIGELRGLLNSWPQSAEAALLVEPGWQDKGIGDALFGRLFAAARNRGIKKLHMLCLSENTRMRNLARKHDASLEIDGSDVGATLAPPWPTPISVFVEILGDTRSYVSAGLHTAK